MTRVITRAIATKFVKNRLLVRKMKGSFSGKGDFDGNIVSVNAIAILSFISSDEFPRWTDIVVPFDELFRDNTLLFGGEITS